MRAAGLLDEVGRALGDHEPMGSSLRTPALARWEETVAAVGSPRVSLMAQRALDPTTALVL